MLRLIASLSVPIWSWSLVVGYRSSVPALVVAGYVVALAGLLAVVFSVLALRSYFIEASRELGVRVSPRNSPPIREDRYQAWLERNGLPLAPPRSE
jgi:hypothetical protein